MAWLCTRGIRHSGGTTGPVSRQPGTCRARAQLLCSQTPHLGTAQRPAEPALRDSAPRPTFAGPVAPEQEMLYDCFWRSLSCTLTYHHHG